MKLKIILIIFLLFNFTDSCPQIVNILDSLKNRMDYSSGKERVEVMISYGKMSAQSSTEDAYDLLFQAISESKKNEYYDCLVKAYTALANVFIPRGQPDSALYYSLASINISSQHGLYDLLAHTYTTLGDYYYETDDYKQSYQAFFTSDSILSNFPANEYICINYLKFSRLLYYLNEYESAISYLNKGINIANKNGFNNMLVDLHNKLASILIKAENYSEAENNLNNAIRLSEQQMYNLGLAESYQIYGDFHTDYTKDYKNAKFYYTKAYEFYTLLGLKSFAATLSTKISHILLLENQYEDALFYAERSLKLREESGIEDLIGSSLINLGNIYISLKDYVKASDLIISGLQKTRKLHINANGYYKLYNISIKINDYKGALESYRIYSTYIDSISQKESFKTISKIELKYEFEKSMNEIQQLEYDLQTKKLTYSVIFSIGLLFATIIAVIAFMSKRKLNLKLESINIDNEKIIEERTIKLKNEIAVREKTEKDLEAALEKEKHINILKSKFVSMVSHEFRTPLTGIKTSVDLLKMNLEKEHKTSKNDKYVTRINNELNRLTSLLNDVLSVGLTDSGKMKFTLSETDLLSLIKNLIEYLKRNNDKFIPPDKISVNGVRRKVLCDRRMMETMLTNLFLNANKYSGDNPEWNIEINFEDKYYDIKISDNGIGIPEDEIPFIFDSFFRGSNTTGISGTGIGLVSVKQMINEHNGTISAKNNDDKGVTFTVTIPDKK